MSSSRGGTGRSQRDGMSGTVASTSIGIDPNKSAGSGVARGQNPSNTQSSNNSSNQNVPRPRGAQETLFRLHAEIERTTRGLELAKRQVVKLDEETAKLKKELKDLTAQQGFGRPREAYYRIFGGNDGEEDDSPGTRKKKKKKDGSKNGGSSESTGGGGGGKGSGNSSSYHQHRPGFSGIDVKKWERRRKAREKREAEANDNNAEIADGSQDGSVLGSAGAGGEKSGAADGMGGRNTGGNASHNNSGQSNANKSRGGGQNNQQGCNKNAFGSERKGGATKGRNSVDNSNNAGAGTAGRKDGSGGSAANDGTSNNPHVDNSGADQSREKNGKRKKLRGGGFGNDDQSSSGDDARGGSDDGNSGNNSDDSQSDLHSPTKNPNMLGHCDLHNAKSASKFLSSGADLRKQKLEEQLKKDEERRERMRNERERIEKQKSLRQEKALLQFHFDSHGKGRLNFDRTGVLRKEIDKKEKLIEKMAGTIDDIEDGNKNLRRHIGECRVNRLTSAHAMHQLDGKIKRVEERLLQARAREAALTNGLGALMANNTGTTGDKGSNGNGSGTGNGNGNGSSNAGTHGNGSSTAAGSGGGGSNGNSLVTAASGQRDAVGKEKSILKGCRAGNLNHRSPRGGAGAATGASSRGASSGRKRVGFDTSGGGNNGTHDQMLGNGGMNGSSGRASTKYGANSNQNSSNNNSAADSNSVLALSNNNASSNANSNNSSSNNPTSNPNNSMNLNETALFLANASLAEIQSRIKERKRLGEREGREFQKEVLKHRINLARREKEKKEVEVVMKRGARSKMVNQNQNQSSSGNNNVAKGSGGNSARNQGRNQNGGGSGNNNSPNGPGEYGGGRTVSEQADGHAATLSHSVSADGGAFRRQDSARKGGKGFIPTSRSGGAGCSPGRTTSPVAGSSKGRGKKGGAAGFRRNGESPSAGRMSGSGRSAPTLLQDETSSNHSMKKGTASQWGGNNTNNSNANTTTQTGRTKGGSDSAGFNGGMDQSLAIVDHSDINHIGQQSSEEKRSEQSERSLMRWIFKESFFNGIKRRKLKQRSKQVEQWRQAFLTIKHTTGRRGFSPSSTRLVG